MNENKVDYKGEIIIVSGYPYCGTSVMMKALGVGGLNLAYDLPVSIDQRHPEGIFEFREPIVENGKIKPSIYEKGNMNCIKLITNYLRFLSEQYFYSIIFLWRDFNEMQVRWQGKTNDVEHIKDIFYKDLVYVSRMKNAKSVFIKYNDLIRNPKQEFLRIQTMLNKTLDVEKMCSIIEPEMNHGVLSKEELINLGKLDPIS